MTDNGEPPKKPAASAPADDPLTRYRTKRDAGNTNEPYAITTGAQASEEGTWAGDFVVHLHDATRRHYDLRIQVGGTLASFAVPRGPSLSPKQKRLAVQTENHPLEYLDFEDVIPQGNYGAGPMIVWDIGRVQYLVQPIEQGLVKGKLDFVLQGRKIRGRFALVETTARVKPPPKQRQWLLLKKSDGFTQEVEIAEARGELPPEPVNLEPESVYSGLRVEQLSERKSLERDLVAAARRLGAKEAVGDVFTQQPMLCSNDGAALRDEGRLYELKLDGVRILAERSAALVSPGVRLKYRSGRAATQSYPDVARALSTLFASDFVVDGEIVAYDELGRPRFQRLAGRIHARRHHDVARARIETPVHYLVFDLLRLGGYDLTALPLIQRKELLKQLVPGKGVVRFLDHIDAQGEALFSFCTQERLEGVVSKLKEGPYRYGPHRSGDWVKHKCEQHAAFVVVGWIQGKGERGLIGSLELASYDHSVEPPQLQYRGRVGTGIDTKTLQRLAQQLPPMVQATCPAHGAVIEGGKRQFFVAPTLVVNVRFLEWTEEGRIRMGVFLGLNSGLAPQDCAAAPERARRSYRWVDKPEAPEQKADLGEQLILATYDTAASQRLPGRVVVSNQDKVFWPNEGYTKGDLLSYYHSVAPVLLPILDKRPVMLVRYPDGIQGKSFYQWNVPSNTPDWVKTLQLKHEERDGKHRASFLIDSVDSLLFVINLGCIPLHVLASREGSLDHCDFITIDFDLGGNPFQEAVHLALSLKELLDDLGLVGYPKTSGQSGLHVLIPLGPNVSFRVAKTLVELIGRLVQGQHAERATMERRVADRSGRVYIDTGQTGRSRTIVAPYSVRAYPGARVSTPLSWDEVHLALRPESFTIFTVPERAAAADAYSDILHQRPDVAGLLVRLERWLK